MNNNYYNQGYQPIPVQYKPISAWGYIGYQILYSIPIIGFIFLIVNALGASNVNVKNFARSYFCVLVLALIIFLVFGLVGGITFSTFGSN